MAGLRYPCHRPLTTTDDRPPTTDQPTHFVYIVRCADGSLYTGYARDVDERVSVHNTGKGAKYTASRRPVRLVYREACESLSAALKREHELKGWTRQQKEALIAHGRP